MSGGEANVSLKQVISLTFMIFGIFGAALSDGASAPADAQAVSYAWCSQGEEIHCYYSTRQQCEEEVDYHGFCVSNPDYQAQEIRAPRPVRRR
ncbi:MAG: DUF3551 domain-containing protein [Xanthobacteraceae bacterium]